jgi:hypothetical protein
MIYAAFDATTNDCLYTMEVPVAPPEAPGVYYIQSDDRVLIHTDSRTLYAKNGVIVRKPPCPDFDTYKWDWQNEAWVVDLELLKGQKSKEIEVACRAAIVSGFESSALGTPHTYPCKMTDQQNLNGSVVASMLEVDPSWTTPFWCEDAAGEWDFRPHTAAQIQQVGRECKAHIIAQMDKNKTLQAAVEAASTPEEIQAIAW